ncbi:MAG: SRPBCC domain-containing protein [Bacteroidetes bacterium]|nr:SRPBCC domain-containing protein [Bacteroidota bacterium]
MTQVNSNGKASTVKSTFSRETEVSINIHADKSIIWALLTNAGDFKRWNSTIISIEGDIKPNGKIVLTSTLDPKRKFKLAIKEMEVGKKLVWGDAMGKRTYSLIQYGKDQTQFTMHEKIGGPFFPLFAKMIPSFDNSFEQFAFDLKKEAEAIAQTK